MKTSAFFAVLFASTTLAFGDVHGATLTSEPFGQTQDGKPVTLYTMKNSHGVSVSFMSWGGVVTKIETPDRHGKPADIVLGFPTLHDYETKSVDGGLYFGALVGRYANRIAKGQFTLDGQTYHLDINNPPNSLHGGNDGYNKRIWNVERLQNSGSIVSAVLKLSSPDGDQGYPGALDIAVTYSLGEDNSFRIDYSATTNKDTVLNLTNHSYFNLAGPGSPHGVLDQVMWVDADQYTPTDRTSIPFAENASVAGTPFDFRTPKAISRDLKVDNEQLLFAQGYDHNWVLNKHHGPDALEKATTLYDPASGRTLECDTTEPGVQIYTSNFVKGNYAGNGGIYRQTEGVTFETQHFPDSPNHPNFPTTELKPGQTFKSSTIFRFGVRRG
ncbi:galactose mutarotase [Ameyamaea chiangmaiensis]|uniref:Aldose 1-epimerase n=1 Tax=Ameyamaea chiangmaiensis TaxID=442969 RepID=A0A850P5A9_9PROT|nr:aldose epimerase family protein [Ameyamaea chiangmaiensis]MBS4076042.1 galactose mutarotase [Ameyamaea chiangmaiensis]NVN39817.1 galactose mutarotase [Ameyamaea chiangmaiensis]